MDPVHAQRETKPQRCAIVPLRPLFTGAGLLEPEHHHPDEVRRLDPDLNVGGIRHDVRSCESFRLTAITWASDTWRGGGGMVPQTRGPSL